VASFLELFEEPIIAGSEGVQHSPLIEYDMISSPFGVSHRGADCLQDWSDLCYEPFAKKYYLWFA
jgi:hypothetical protein